MNLPEGIEMYLSNGLLPLYYFVVFVCMSYIYYKFKFDKVVLFFIFLYSEGMFAYFAQEISVINKIYKLSFFIFALYLFFDKLIKKKFNHYKTVFTFVILSFTLLFFLNSYINNEDYVITFSQLQKKVIPYLFLFGVSFYFKNKLEFYMNALLWIIGVQFIFAFVKLIIWGFGESLVGSISFNGGGPSNVLPILAFFLIWMKKNGNLIKKDWIYLILVFSVSIIGDKRSIIFIFPTVIALTMFFSKKINPKYIFNFILIGLLGLYISVKLNPSLNPESSRWGSFDINHLNEYIVNYTFGNNTDSDEVQGRGAASQALILKLVNSIEISNLAFFIGNGFSQIDVDYDNFNGYKYGLTSKGSASGLVQTFIAYGILGVLLFLYFGYLIIKFNKNKVVRWVLLSFIIWDFLFFYYTSINTYAFAVTILFIGFYSYKPTNLLKPLSNKP